MTVHPSQRPSSPPVSPEDERAAKVRIEWLTGEADAERKRDRRALLRYKLGSVYERTLRDDPSAVREYLAAYNVDPSFRLPLFALMRIFERRRSYKNLGRLYDAQARAAQSKRELATALLDRAQVLEDRFGQPLDARTTLRQATEECPEDNAAALFLELSARSAGDKQTLRRALDLQCAHTGDARLRAALLLELAALEESEHNIDRALALLGEAAALPGTEWRTWERLERLARRQGRNGDVIAALEGRAVLAMTAAGDPAHIADSRFSSVEDALAEAGVLWYEAGRLREAVGDLDGAMECFSHAVASNGEDVLFRLSQMALADVSGRRVVGADAARHVLDRGIAGPWASALYGQLARFLISSGDTDGAVQAIRSALQEDPTSAAAHAVLEWVLTKDSRYSETLRLLEQQAEVTGADARWMVLWKAGDIAVHRAKDFVRAKGYFEEALRCAPDPVPLAREFALTSLVAHRFDAAGDAMDVLLRAALDPGERRFWNRARYTTLRHGLGDQEAADAVLREGLADPAQAEWTHGAALVHGAMTGHPAFAAEAHERIANLARDDGAVHAHLVASAVGWSRAGNDERALVLLGRAHELDEAEPLTTLLLARALEVAGRSSDAAAVLRRAAASANENRAAEGNLLLAAVSLERGGNLAELEETYSKMLDRSPDSRSALWLYERLANKHADRDMQRRAGSWIAEAELASESVSFGTLAHGERLWLLDEDPQRAKESLLHAVFSRDVGLEAALTLAILPRTVTTELERVLSAKRLLEEGSAKLLPYALRLGLREASTPEVQSEREEFRRASAELASGDPWHALEAIRDRQPGAKDAWIALADRETGAARDELALTAVRQGHLDGAPVGDVHGVIERAGPTPSLAAAAIAFDHGDAGDAAARIHALEAMADAGAPHAEGWCDAAIAREFLRAGDAKAACEVARSVTERDPNALAAWHTRLFAGRMIQSHDDVARALDRLADALHGDARAELLLDAGDLHRDEFRDAEAAERRYRLALRSTPGNATAYARLSEVLAAKGDHAALLDLMAHRAAETDDAKEIEDLYYDRARLLARLRDFAASHEALRALELLSPEHAGAAALRVEVLVALERWPEAVAALRTFAALPVPAAQRRIAHLGAAEFLDKRLGDIEGAARELHAALELKGDRGVILLRLADLAARSGERGEAIAHFEAALPSLHGAPKGAVLRSLADLTAEAGDTARARAYARQALDGDPSDVEALARVLSLETDPVARARATRITEEALFAELRDAAGSRATLTKLREYAALVDDAPLRAHAAAVLGALGEAAPVTAHESSARPLRVEVLLKAVLPEAFLALAEAADPAWELLDDSAAVTRWTPNEDKALAEELAQIARRFSLGTIPVVRTRAQPAALTLTVGRDGPRWIVGAEVVSPMPRTKRYLAHELAAAFGSQTLALVVRALPDAGELLFATLEAATGESLRGSRTSAPLADALSRTLSRKAKRAAKQLAAQAPVDPEDLVLRATAAALVCAALATGDIGSALAAALRGPVGEEPVGRSPLASLTVEFWLSTAARELSRAAGSP
jgi:Tfp pilus assembly protein PilF